MAKATHWLDTADFHFDIHYRHYAEDFQTRYPLRDGDSLRFGDQFKIAFTPPRDAQVYIYHLDSQGRLREWLSELHNGQAVTAGQAYTLPAADRSFTLDATPGTESLFIRASRAPDRQLYPHYLALRAALNQGG